jgi:hypothetical protein
MISGKKLGLISLIASTLVLIPAFSAFSGMDILVAWAVGSFISFLAVIFIVFIVSLILHFSPSHRKLQIRAHRYVEGQCEQCGYDLRAHSPGDSCPECGLVVPPRNIDDSMDDDEVL